MKWFFVLFLAIIIFGGAAWFGYNFVFKEDIQVRKEQRGEVTPEQRLDLTLPEFEAAAKLRQEGKIPEARAALTAFIQKYPSGQHAEEAKDLLGEVNVGILLSRTPSPEKEEYIVKPGDVLQRVAHKVKSTPELIMRMNNMSSTMLTLESTCSSPIPISPSSFSANRNCSCFSIAAAFSNNTIWARKNCRPNSRP